VTFSELFFFFFFFFFLVFKIKVNKIVGEGSGSESGSPIISNGSEFFIIIYLNLREFGLVIVRDYL
jgi:hypothetical protein